MSIWLDQLSRQSHRYHIIRADRIFFISQNSWWGETEAHCRMQLFSVRHRRQVLYSYIHLRTNHNCKNKFKIIKIFWSASKLNKIVLIKRKWSSDWEILARRRIMFKSVLKNIGRRRRIIDFSQIGKVVIRFIKTNPNNHFFWWDRDRNEIFLLNFWWFSLSLMKILDL